MKNSLKNTALGGLIGLSCGSAIVVADLVVTAMRWGHRFEPSYETFRLVGIVSLFTLVPSLLLGGIVGAIFLGRGSESRVKTAWWPNPLALAPLALVLSGAVFYVVGERQKVVPDGFKGSVSAAEQRDVLWLVIDTLRADTLYGKGFEVNGSAEGQATFPRAQKLGALAAKSTVFYEAEAPAGWTIPSTAALLTGRHPSTLGSRAGLLPAGADTLAEILGAAGWRTVAHIDNTLLDESNGFASGFQRFVKHSAMDFSWHMNTARLMPLGMRETYRYSHKISYSGVENLVDRAVEDLESAGDEPLFLYVHAMDVHEPYWSPVQDKELARAAANLHAQDSATREAARRDVNSTSPLQKDAVRAEYAAELDLVDRELGRLLERFDQLRGLDNALVVVTADHGEEFWEHDRMGHGHALWGEIVRVPLIVHLPEKLSGDLSGDTVPRIDAPVSLMDVMPTVTDVLGLERAGDGFDFEGRSLLPALRGQVFEPKPLHSEQFRFNRTTHRWREGNLVLVDARLPDDRHMVRLFDVEEDPAEAHDLSEERPDQVARLQSALQAHLAGIQRGGVDRGEAQTNEAGLKHLGYN